MRSLNVHRDALQSASSGMLVGVNGEHVPHSPYDVCSAVAPCRVLSMRTSRYAASAAMSGSDCDAQATHTQGRLNIMQAARNTQQRTASATVSRSLRMGRLPVHVL